MNYIIKNSKNEYLTKKNIHADISFTTNKDLAYVFSSIAIAEGIKKQMMDEQNHLKLEVVSF